MLTMQGKQNMAKFGCAFKKLYEIQGVFKKYFNWIWRDAARALKFCIRAQWHVCTWYATAGCISNYINPFRIKPQKNQRCALLLWCYTFG